MTLETLLIFVPAAFLLSVSPGPNNLLAISHAARFGMRNALLAGLGRLVAFSIMIAVTAVGLGAVLATSQLAFAAIKWAGAAYLVYLGIRTFLARTDGFEADKAGQPAVPVTKQARSEFLVAAGNPKAILFFTAFFPQFIDTGSAVGLQFFLLGAAFILTEFTALSLYVIGGKQVARLLKTARGMLWMNRISGSALFGAGVVLATSSK